MKRPYLFVLIALLSCSKDVKPELSEAFIGNFYLSEKGQNSIMNTTWKISKMDDNHVNILVELHADYNDQTADYHGVFTIKNVLVDFEKSLKFDNEYTFEGSLVKVTGNAALTGDALTYDLKSTDGKSTEYGSKQLFRR